MKVDSWNFVELFYGMADPEAKATKQMFGFIPRAVLEKRLLVNKDHYAKQNMTEDEIGNAMVGLIKDVLKVRPTYNSDERNFVKILR